MFSHMFKKQQTNEYSVYSIWWHTITSSEGTIFYIAVRDGIIMYHGLVYLLVATYVYLYIIYIYIYIFIFTHFFTCYRPLLQQTPNSPPESDGNVGGKQSRSFWVNADIVVCMPIYIICHHVLWTKRTYCISHAFHLLDFHSMYAIMYAFNHIFWHVLTIHPLQGSTFPPRPKPSKMYNMYVKCNCLVLSFRKSSLQYCWWFRNPIPNHLRCTKPCKLWDKLRVFVCIMHSVDGSDMSPHVPGRCSGAR